VTVSLEELHRISTRKTGPLHRHVTTPSHYHTSRNTMLQTSLTHILSKEDLAKTIKEHKNVMVCCGRMGPMCIPVYRVMQEIQPAYPHVAFRDMEFDIPDAVAIKSLPECSDFRGLPFTVYYKNGKVVKATSSVQTKEQVTAILDEHFAGNAS
jgi:thioredoxin 1